MGRLLLLLAFAGPLLATDGLRIPAPTTQGAMEMKADGRIAPGEWGDATVTVLPCGMLFAKQVGGQVWFAVVPDAKHATYLDVFLQDESGTVHNLHASLQWGERAVAGDRWTDREPETRWGKPADWGANRITWAPGGRDQAETTRASFTPYEAHEFWISRGRFAGRAWRVRIEIRDFAGKEAVAVIPAGSTRHETGGWSVWRLE